MGETESEGVHAEKVSRKGQWPLSGGGGVAGTNEGREGEQGEYE